MHVDFAKMLAFFRGILDWIKSLFWKEEMELTLVGLQYSGKTTFVNVIAVSFAFYSNYFVISLIVLLFLYLVISSCMKTLHSTPVHLSPRICT